MILIYNSAKHMWLDDSTSPNLDRIRWTSNIQKAKNFTLCHAAVAAFDVLCQTLDEDDLHIISIIG